MWHFDGAASTLLQDVSGVILSFQGSGQVLAAEVVDELHEGLLFAFDLARRDDPAERSSLLAQIAWQFSVKLLARDSDVLVVEVNAHIDLIFFIIKVRAKGVVFLLGIYAQSYDGQQGDDNDFLNVLFIFW